MRSVVLLYHIFLPPILLFRFCSPRPPEPSSSPRTRDEIFPEGVTDFRAKNHPRVNYSAAFLNRNKTDILKTNAFKFGKVSGNTWMLSFKTDSHKKGQFYSTFLNLTKSRENLFPQEVVNNTNSFQQLGSYSNFFNSVNRNQRRNVDGHTFSQSNHHKKVDGHTFSHSNHPLDSAVRQSFLTEASQSENQSVLQRDVNLHSSKVDSVPYPSERHNDRAKVRERRNINETLSTEFKLSSRGTPPEYMVHLFKLLSGTRYEALRNFVATGFLNINNDAGNHGTTSPTQSLAFNLSLPYERETVHYAELRLYFILSRHRTRAQNVTESPGNSGGHKYIIRVFETQQRHGLKQKQQIAFHVVEYVDNVWLSFNVTSAAQNWSTSGLRTLEVSYNVCKHCTNSDVKSNDIDEDDNRATLLTLNIDNENNKGPFLVIFSKKHDTSTSVPHNREKRDTTTHNKDTNISLNKNLQLRNSDTDNNMSDNLSNLNYFQGLVEFISKMNNDTSNHDESNELESLKNSVIFTNPFHEQSHDGREESDKSITGEINRTFLNEVKSFPSTNNRLNVYRPFQRRNTGTSTPAINILLQDKTNSWKEEKRSNSLLFSGENVNRGDVNRMSVRRETKARYRRHSKSGLKHGDGTSGSRQKRSKKKRNSCQRNEMYVDFETIKWDKVIIFPRGYQAFECTGKCHTPISEYLTPTKHAIIQTLVHTSFPDQASRACCVPTKLDPISILYWDENDDIKYDYTYEGMVVAECGCR